MRPRTGGIAALVLLAVAGGAARSEAQELRPIPFRTAPGCRRRSPLLTGK